jgi:hypothetical protein
LIAGATARAASLLEQNQADKIKAGLIVRKLWLSITKRNNAIAQGFGERNFTKITTVSYSLQMKL